MPEEDQFCEQLLEVSLDPRLANLGFWFHLTKVGWDNIDSHRSHHLIIWPRYNSHADVKRIEPQQPFRPVPREELRFTTAELNYGMGHLSVLRGILTLAASLYEIEVWNNKLHTVNCELYKSTWTALGWRVPSLKTATLCFAAVSCSGALNGWGYWESFPPMLFNINLEKKIEEEFHRLFQCL